MDLGDAEDKMTMGNIFWDPPRKPFSKLNHLQSIGRTTLVMQAKFREN